MMGVDKSKSFVGIGGCGPIGLSPANCLLS